MPRKFPRELKGPRKVTRNRSITARLLVICGTDETEKQYLNGVKTTYRNAAVTVKLKTRGRKSPLEVVKYAIDLQSESGDDFDEVWVVFDVDDFNIEDAVKEAERNQIKVAISNPCFEFWLILHFISHRAYLAGANQAQTILKRYYAGYDKSRLDFDKFRGGIEDACHRARSIDEAASTTFSNPSTGVWRLVEAMLPKSGKA
ncbi:RloB family protein [Microbispora rosea]|uniref:RloB family protein n=1 Tax=Microbispora rosea TaxID=58117 RepID=UPI0037ABDC45